MSRNTAKAVVRRIAPEQFHTASAPALQSRWRHYTLPGLTILLVAAYFVAQLRPASRTGPMHIHEFGALPVVYQGRVKPLDTLARNTLMIISDRQTYVDADGKRQPAIRFLLDVISQSDAAKKHRVFRIENDQVLGLLGLPERSGLRYAVEEFQSKVPEVARQASRAQAEDENSRDLFDTKVIEVARQLDLFARLSRLEIPHLIPPESTGEEWRTYGELDDQLRSKVVARAQMLIKAAGADGPDRERQLNRLLADESFRAFLQAETEKVRSEMSWAMKGWGAMLAAYSSDDAKAFNAEVAAFSSELRKRISGDVVRAGFEVLFNRLEPFYHCTLLYAVAFLVSCIGWLGWERTCNRVALAILASTFITHTFALCARMALQGRPPVTNLYSSAIFIGWGCVLLAMVLESIHKNGIGNLAAAITGFLTLLVAHNLAGDGDTLEMMQAVLDTNFWLATHVTCVTIGYAATFMAGFIGVLFILRGLLTASLDNQNTKVIGRMVYGIICFATLFSFTGTVLGGIWADQSWGRFWGWDPKENGALLIVLWNALILHARWGGMIRERGMAVLAVLGNIVTAWSWFGTNMLGIGLHAYGFIPSAVFWLLVFVASQLAIGVAGMLPRWMWRSNATSEAAAIT